MEASQDPIQISGGGYASPVLGAWVEIGNESCITITNRSPPSNLTDKGVGEMWIPEGGVLLVVE